MLGLEPHPLVLFLLSMVRIQTTRLLRISEPLIVLVNLQLIHPTVLLLVLVEVAMGVFAIHLP